MLLHLLQSKIPPVVNYRILALCEHPMLTDELLTSLFDARPHALAAPMAEWLNSSRRFAAFAREHQTKIRKKLRATQEPEALRDLQLELETAYLLLRERSLSLVYEPQPGKLGRSPDFAVRFTTSLTFMVEVTRLRAPRAGMPPLGDRFSDMLCSKLGQLAAGSGNLLIAGLEGAKAAPDELRAAMLRIQQRAEVNDPAIVQRPGFRDRAEFFQHYHRLSGVLLRGIPLQGESAMLWNNPQGRQPLPARVQTALVRSHTL